MNEDKSYYNSFHTSFEMPMKLLMETSLYENENGQQLSDANERFIDMFTEEDKNVTILL